MKRKRKLDNSWPVPDMTKIELGGDEYRYALNYISANVDNKTKKKEFVKYAKAINLKDYREIEKLADYQLNTIGKYAWLLNRGARLPEISYGIYKIEIERLYELIKKQNKNTNQEVTTQRKGVKEYIRLNTLKTVAQIDAWLDNKSYTESVIDFLADAGIKTINNQHVETYYQELIDELSNAVGKKDLEVKEAYAHIKQKDVRLQIKFLKSVLKELEKFSLNKKAKRTVSKSRKKKQVSKEKQVSSVKYLKEDSKRKIVSISPTEIIGADKLWVFNTKTRKLIQYQCDINISSGLSIKGTTIQNFDPKKSFAKTIRAIHEKKLDAVRTVGKVKLRKIMDDIKAKPSAVNGRLNDHCLILRKV